MITTEQLYEIFIAHSKVITDSRKVEKGSMFFALRGENFDGNDYADKAIESGASYCVVDRADVAKSDRYIVVKDVLTTLQELARYHRRQLGIPIIAITGSNGKTTTKELLSRILMQEYRIAYTRGNLNNHIGVPLTLLSMGRDIEIGVVEMGANHCSEIALLCSIAEPNFGVITNIGKAHLEGFGGEEGIMRGKGELYDYLESTGGTAFYLNESPQLREMINAHSALNAIPYDTSFLKTLASSDKGEMRLGYDKYTLKTNLIGDYNVYNIATAIFVGGYFEIYPDQIKIAIESYEPDNGRSQCKITSKNRLYIDSYNANPSSMKVSIDNFSKLITSDDKIAILGDMRELGDYSEPEHREVVSQINKIGIKTFFVGTEFARVCADTEYLVYKNVEELVEYLQLERLEGFSILIKGSRGIHLERVENFL